MTRPRTALLLALGWLFVAGWAVRPVSATGDLSLLWFLHVLSLRVDTLTARVDRQAFGAAVFACAHVDAVSEPLPGVVAVQGWGFGCGYEDSRVVAVVDDIELSNLAARVARPDVNAAYASVCNVQGQTGAVVMVDMSAFEPGFNSDHVHTFKLRVYPPSWPSVVPFAVADSPAVTFTTY